MFVALVSPCQQGALATIEEHAKERKNMDNKEVVAFNLYMHDTPFLACARTCMLFCIDIISICELLPMLADHASTLNWVSNAHPFSMFEPSYWFDFSATATTRTDTPIHQFVLSICTGSWSLGGFLA